MHEIPLPFTVDWKEGFDPNKRVWPESRLGEGPFEVMGRRVIDRCEFCGAYNAGPDDRVSHGADCGGVSDSSLMVQFLINGCWYDSSNFTAPQATQEVSHEK